MGYTGTLEDRGLSHLLKAQALLIQAKDDPTSFQECEFMDVSSLLGEEGWVREFNACPFLPIYTGIFRTMRLISNVGCYPSPLPS